MLKWSILGLITGYQRIVSPVLGVNCRFYPTCSTYAKEAVSTFGVVKGFMIAVKRLFKCHPFHLGGIDELERK
tara:strand:+ start:1278 stop:1496 length:219 start_codon:yes stop_codon:yes gene_type:complete